MSGEDCERTRRNSRLTGKSGVCQMSIQGLAGINEKIGTEREGGSKRPRSHVRWLAVSPAEDQDQNQKQKAAFVG